MMMREAGVVALVAALLSSPAAAAKADGGGSCGGRASSVWVFGDSYADTGNLGDLGRALTHAWYDPYGRTFPGRPTGRFSDGRVLTDFIGTTTHSFFLLLVPPPRCQSTCTRRQGVTTPALLSTKAEQAGVNEDVSSLLA